MNLSCTICGEPAKNLFYVTLPFNERVVRKGPICGRHIEKVFVRDDTAIAESLVPEGFGEEDEIDLTPPEL